MTDKELLTLAAGAAGIVVHHWTDSGVPVLNDGIDTNIKPWNPLTDPDDALRLAVKLEMRLEISNAMTAAFASNADVALEHSDGNPLAATMRAIVRAAAEIGRRMP